MTLASTPFEDDTRSSWKTWTVSLLTLQSPGRMLGREGHSELMSQGSAEGPGMQIQLKKKKITSESSEGLSSPDMVNDTFEV